MLRIFRSRPARMCGLAALLVLVAGLIAGQGAGDGADANPVPPAVSDTGILTMWPLPTTPGARGPWQIKWDETRNLVWFAEGNHISVPQLLDRVAALDPATGVLREWGGMTQGGYVHGTVIDRSGNIWFTEAFQNKIGRLEPDTNTITEWTLHPQALVHGIAVDDIDPQNVTVWFTERNEDVIGSLNLQTGVYLRHQHPFLNSRPHSVVVAPDHSVWFVDACANRAGQLIPGATTDTWNLWPGPTAAWCGPPDGVGPLFGILLGADFWYTEGKNDNVVRLRPGDNTMTIWRIHATGATRLTTQLMYDPDGNIFFSEMAGNRIGRLEPVGATTPTVVAVQPTQLAQPAPAAATAPAITIVNTPIVSQLTPVTQVLAGTRTGSIVEWRLPTPVATPLGRFIGPARAWWGGGGFWVSEVSANRVSRFAPYTATPGTTGTPVPPSPTSTAVPPSSTATPVPASPTVTAVPASPTLTTAPASPTTTGVSTTATPVPPTPCPIQFSDVDQTNPFYAFIRCLACRGVVSGYADGTFRWGANVTRGQTSKIVSNAANFQDAISSTQQTFTDVAGTSPFWLWVERLSRRGYISGYACGGAGEPCDPAQRPYFRPNNDVTRGQLAKIVASAAQFAEPVPTTQQTFADVAPTNAFWVFVERVAARQIISGYQCGGPGEPCDPATRPYFRWGANATRGQSAKIVASAFYPNCSTPQR